MEKEFKNDDIKRKIMDKYIEEKYPELKDLSNEENAKYYASFMQELYEISDKQYNRVLNANRIKEYKDLKKELECLAENHLLKFEIRKRKTGDVGISIVFEMLVSTEELEDLVGNIVAEIMLKYKDYIMQIVEAKKIMLSFSIELTDKILIENFEDKLKELDLKMKYLISKNNN